MKLAVISDIHGNIIALRAALAEIAREGADRVLVLGDLFEAGHVRDILDVLRGCGALVIRGNGEGYHLDNRAGKFGDEWARYDQFAALRETHAELTPDDFRWMEALPCQISLRYGDVSLRMVHGSPKADNDSLNAGRPRALHRALRLCDETIVLCGHAHRAMLRQFGRRYICNVGSVGDNFDPAFTADVTFIDIAGSDIAFEQRCVPYDFEAWRRVANGNVYSRLSLRGTQLGRGLAGKSLFMEFLDEATRRGGWPVPNEVWNGLFEEWEERKLI